MQGVEDVIFIAYSDVTNLDALSELPLDRLELFRSLAFPKMLYHEGGFRSQLDVINRFYHGSYFADSAQDKKSKMLSVWNLPSYAGAYISDLVEGEGYRCEWINNLDAEMELFSSLYKKKAAPPLVALSTTFHLTWAATQRVVKKLRAVDPDMRIVLGGAMASTKALEESPQEWESILRRMKCEAVFYATNSESDFLRYLRNWNCDEEKAKIQNLVWFNRDGAYRCNPAGWNKPSIKSASLVNSVVRQARAFETIQMRTLVGCPFSCRFCSYPALSRGLHVVDMDCLRQSVKELANFQELRQIVLLDDTANVPRRRFEEVIRLLGELSVQWYCFLRPQYVDMDIAMRMRDAGCAGVSLGVESGSGQILVNMNKKARAGDMANGIACLKKVDIVTSAFFIIGFPGETTETVSETKSFITGTGLDYYMLKEFYHIPGSGMDEFSEKFGLSGSGSKWRHDTMDAMQASILKEKLFLEIDNVEHLDPDVGMWQLVVIGGAGFTADEAKRSQHLLNSVIKNQMRNGVDSDDFLLLSEVAEIAFKAHSRKEKL